ncbi:hypothetical protein EDB80DRAFT_687549 [Ilyonectria destructans]|nr:hypothetical protein EDB80DRAFT_687549 [Ilyonectria destructans]
MQLSKTVAIVVALALGGVEAHSAPSETTLVTSVVAASTATDATEHVPRAICNQIFPQPKAFKCDAEGYITNDSGKLGDAVFQPTVEACADYCLWLASCNSFLYRWGQCQLYGGDFSSLGFFSQSSGGSYWYQMECFNC